MERLPSACWIDASRGAYVVVNGGDILHRWTSERLLSTPHQVRNVSGEVRYTIPFFCDPDHDTMIECPPIRFGDYPLWFARKSYDHMAHEPPLTDAVVAPGTRAAARW